MGSTLASSTRLHKMEYRWAFFILMAVLEMLKASCIKPDEGKMLSAPIIAFNPKAVLAWVIFFFQEIIFSSFSSVPLHCPLEGC